MKQRTEPGTTPSDGGDLLGVLDCLIRGYSNCSDNYIINFDEGRSIKLGRLKFLRNRVAELVEVWK
jgi:hypothetical protein